MVGQVYEKRVLNPAAFGVKASGNSLGATALEDGDWKGFKG